jgi:membrane protein required for colicin V production
MNWLDYALIALIGISSGLALLRGLIREATGLLTWVMSFLLTSRLDRWTGETVSRWSTGGSDAVGHLWQLLGGATGQTVGFLVLFVLISLAIRLPTIAFIERLRSVARRAGLAWTDRLSGFMFGLLRGVSVVLMGFLVMRTLNVPEPQWVTQSALAPMAHEGASRLADWLPEELLSGLETWRVLPKHSEALLRWAQLGRGR